MNGPRPVPGPAQGGLGGGLATSGYEQSVANLAQVSLAGANVFGDAAGGYTAALTIGA